MLVVCIFVCAILIGCNIFYNTDEMEEQQRKLNHENRRKS